MTSTQSVNKRKNPTFVWFRQQLSKSMVFGILLLILMSFVGIVLVNDIAYYAVSEKSKLDLHSEAIYITDIYLSALVFCEALVLAIVVKCFRHLHKKSIADTVYALPISNNQRFIGSLLASLVTIVVPMLLSILFTIAFYSSRSGATMYFEEMLKNSGIKDSDFIWLFSQLGFAQLANMLFAFAVSVFVFSCCGVLFDSVVYTGATGLIALIAYYAFSSIGQSAISLYYWGYDDSVPTILNYLSPISPMICYTYSKLILGEGMYSYYSDVENEKVQLIKDQIAPYYLTIFVIAVVIIAFAFLIHKKRKAEHVGTPIPIKPFYYAITSLALLVCGSLIYSFYLDSFSGYDTLYTQTSVITVTAVSFFAFLAIEVISERKRRATKKRIIQGAVRYVCVVAVGVAVSAVIADINIKNAFDKDIDADEISEIVVNISFEEIGFDYDNGYDEYGYPIYQNEILQSPLANSAFYTDEESIAKLCAELDKFNDIIYKKYKEEGLSAFEDNIFYNNDEPMHYEKGEIFFYHLMFDISCKDGSYKSYSYDNRMSDIEQWALDYLADEYYLSKYKTYEDMYGYDVYYD